MKVLLYAVFNDQEVVTLEISVVVSEREPIFEGSFPQNRAVQPYRSKPRYVRNDV